METIDSEWLKRHLPESHGIKVRLANHLGIDQPKLSKIIAGKRRIQPHEIPRVLDFMQREVFASKTDSAPAGSAAPDSPPASPDQPTAPGLRPTATRIQDRSPDQILAPLRNAAVTPAAYRIEHDMPGFMLAANDVVMVDMSRSPERGDLVIVALRDEENSTSHWSIRRWLDAHVMSGDAIPQIMEIDDNGITLQPRGVVVAVARVMPAAA